MDYNFEKQFNSLWKLLKIQNHIVQSLKRKKNGKQAIELSQEIYLELKKEMLPDLENWYRTKEILKDKITEETIKEDVLHRINAELSKYGIPLLSFDMLL